MSQEHELDENLRQRVASLFDRELPAPGDLGARSRALADAWREQRRARRQRTRALALSCGLAAAACALIWARAGGRLQPSAARAGVDVGCRLPEGVAWRSGVGGQRVLVLGELGRLMGDGEVVASSACELRVQLRDGTLAGQLHALRPSRIVIATSAGSVIVTGTRFSVRARGDELQVVLAAGKVSVESAGGAVQELSAGHVLTRRGGEPASTAPLMAAEVGRLDQLLGVGQGDERAIVPPPSAAGVESVQGPLREAGDEGDTRTARAESDGRSRQSSARGESAAVLRGAGDARSGTVSRVENAAVLRGVSDARSGAVSARLGAVASPGASDARSGAVSPTRGASDARSGESSTARAARGESAHPASKPSRPPSASRASSAEAARASTADAHRSRPEDSAHTAAASAADGGEVARAAARYESRDEPASELANSAASFTCDERQDGAASSGELLARGEQARRRGRLTLTRRCYAAAADGGGADGEVALLRWVRLELDQESLERARALLARHEREYARPTLAAEAAWLNVRVLSAGGQRASARAAAEELMRAHAGTPQARAARAWLRQP